MDDRRFDLFVRSLSSRGSRRVLLAALASGLLVALGLGPSSEQAAAGRRRQCRRPCGPCKRCRRGRCTSTCRGSQTCQHGTCRCPGGGQVCGGVCTDVASDRTNCGSCGILCSAGQGCFEGQCLTAQGTCSPVVDPCLFLPECNGVFSCRCVPAQPGVTRCGMQPSGASLGECTTDEQCRTSYGVGAFCSIQCMGNTICNIPCPV